MKAVCNKKDCVLALGAESAGIFAVYKPDSAAKLRSVRAGFLRDVSAPPNTLCRNRNKNGNIFISDNFGDLLAESNFLNYKKAVLFYLRKEKVKPDVILTDLHPLFKTTIFGKELAKKYKTPHIKVQHHIAHIFSAVGDKVIDIDKLEKNYYCHSEHSEESRTNVRHLAFARDSSLRLRFVQNDKIILSDSFFGIAMDGTGYGLDGNIWGGEVFRIQIPKPNFQIPNKSQSPISKIQTIRVGSLEEQIMIGGDSAVREPARMLISILQKLQITNYKLQTKHKVQNSNFKKEFIYSFVKKFYIRNEFELLYSQLEQNFNCQTTTSTGRVLDAVAVLLGFAGNERNYKHEAVKLLEENSSKPYTDLKPQISFSVIASSPSLDGERGNPADIAINTGLLPAYRQAGVSSAPRNDKRWILQTTPLFEYLIKNIHKEKKRLAATAQLYLTKGFYEIVKKNLNTKYQIPNTIFAAGGMANNKIISEYLENHGVYLAKKIPRGDEGIAAGQIVYYLLNKI